MNTLLDHVLDRPLLAACPDIPLRYSRYADNLAFQTRSVSEGHRVLHEARQLLDAAGFALKGNPGPVNLHRQGAHAHLLGSRIRRHSETRLSYELAKEAWRNFKQQLIQAHEAPQPAMTAQMLIKGWLESHGPAFGDADGRAVTERVLRTAAQTGFWEVESEKELLEAMGKSHERWLSIRREAFSLGAGIHEGSSPLSLYDTNALRASQSTRSPLGDAEAGPAGIVPADTGSIP